MKKLFIICCALLFVLTGCTGTDSNNNPTDFNSWGDISGNSSEGEAPVGSLPPGETAAEGLSLVNTKLCATMDGFYYLKKTGENSLIMHLNEPSMLEVPLCNKPNCKHMDDTCNAFIGEYPFMCEIFTDQTKLYLLINERSKMSQDADETQGFTVSVNFSAWALYSMNLDGTNRERLLELDPEFEIEVQSVQNGNKIYCKAIKSTTKQIDDTHYLSVSESEELICIDPTRKTVTTICDFTNKQIIGVYKNKLVLEHKDLNDIPESAYADPIDFWEHCKNKDYSLLTYDLSTKEEKVLYTNKCGAMKGLPVCAQETVCWFDSGENQMKRLDLNTDEISNLQILMKGKEPYPVNILDGKLIYYFDDGKKMNPEIASVYYYDFVVGENKELPLWVQSNTKEYVTVRGELDGRYLVIPKQDEVKENTWVGTVQYNVTKYYYALISKADYFAAKANYDYFSEG